MHSLRKSLASGLRKVPMWKKFCGRASWWEPKSKSANEATTVRTRVSNREPSSGHPVAPLFAVVWLARSLLSSRAATIAGLSARGKSICLPLTHVAHPSLQVLVHLSVGWGRLRKRSLTVVSKLKRSSRNKRKKENVWLIGNQIKTEVLGMRLKGKKHRDKLNWGLIKYKPACRGSALV